ncbi:uncharacterized protein LOC134251988 [Saccostrea cucullata]|uniref:uncharacterized protein LOC134251988 n=1 Tax=Saccostrea cuccullata TaxID=36930 RepID=UPI002ED3E3AD
MYRLVYLKSVTVSGVRGCCHISRVTSDRVWISDNEGNLILTNTRGEELDRVTDIGGGYGGHTVDTNGDLIYIDSSDNIIKRSTENKEKTTIIQYNTSPWRPRSVYSSPSTGDLLVGMFRRDTYTGKVVRYNSTGENIQTIPNNNITGQGLYSIPEYITENRNGDVIVSDAGRLAVVVTDRDGNYRFSYRGPPSGSWLSPRGICTDALSHILLCDYRSVQMSDSEGCYLTEIKTQQHGIYSPHGLSYDEDTQLLWVGEYNNNTVNLYRVVDTDSLTGLPLEDFKCRKHPSRPLSQFCIPCDVTLCQECIRTSSDHKKHDVRDVEKLFREIHKRKDGDAVLMCLLLCPSYKLNLEEERWIKNYNAVAEIFKLKKIKKLSNLSSLKKFKPILRHDSVNVEFSCEFFKHTSFLRFAKHPDFVDIFLTSAEKDNIAEYCRSWVYPKKEGEVFCWLSPQQTNQLIEKLGEDIFKHPTWQDTSIHEDVFRNFGVPMQILIRGEESVKNFIENLKKGETTMYHASGMIIGCAGSGKSTLLERLKGIDLREILESSKSTRGIDVQADIFDVTGKTIKVNTSSQKQRFKVKIDESSEQKSISEQPAVLLGDMKRLNVKEKGYQKETGSRTSDKESSSDEEMAHESLNLAESRKGNEAAAFLEKEKEIVEDGRQNVPEKSEISGILHVSKDVSGDPEKKITMVDFAGQCSYYASHQIFLSPRAFFILVLNMEKKFDDMVGKEVCSQEGSIYEGWTHKDYLTFWTKSIHQYSSEKAPVLLVGTHAEQKTKEEKEKFFREIWTSLETKDASLQRHFDRKRMFAVGFHENQCIEKIKLSVVDVVQKLDHWGEKLPHSWAMFENFFQEKKNLKIIKKETLLAFNEALPQELKLGTQEDTNIMLQFFHDIREILHFDQEYLGGIIILDVQWFADAFKNVITDKNHAAEDLFKLASQWNKFNETGELSDTLLSAIWEMNNNGYLEHKDDIMRYMEKLGLLAKMDDKKWYVPCMNKKPFPVECFTSYPASSILCYVFDALPAGIFQRLVAICMQIPWKLNSSRDEVCIYQTVAVFHFEGHNILIGMTQTDIHLQVFVIEGEVDKSICQQIKHKIDNILNILSETFHADSKFVVAFKCKATGFCDNKKSSVINESEFIKPTFQCPSCPIGRKHTINSKDIKKYWIQVHDDEAEPTEDKGINKGSLSGSSGSSESHHKDNFAKILKLLQVGTDAVRICFDKFFPKENLEKTLKENETDMRRGQFRFQPPQLEILFPQQGGSNTGVSSLSMDVTIMYKLLRNISGIAPPGNGWGKEPKILDITESDDIERIRLYRNKYSHDPGSSPVMSDDVFSIIWADLSKAILRLGGDVLKRRISEI